MEFEMEARAIPLEKIARGRLVIVPSSNISTFAIRGWRREPGGVDGDYFGLLGPFVEDTALKTPCVRVARSMTLDHIVELPQARIVPKIETKLVHLGWDNGRGAGWLATVEDDLYVMLSSNGEAAVINVRTGEITREFPGRPPALAWFSQWSIAIPRLGEFAEIFHFDGASWQNR
jgi:hypothetical protein